MLERIWFLSGSGEHVIATTATDDFKAIWPGCTHLDCLLTCDHKSAWCARLDKAMDDWNRAHG